MAFAFLDATLDGNISHEEVAGFRNIANRFMATDIDKDNMLSMQEFASALNSP